MNDEVLKVIEQIQKEANFLVKARLIRQLRRDNQISVTQLGVLLKMKPAYICHIYRLNKLPDLVIDGYYSKLITVSHLFSIARLPTSDQMVNIYEKVLQENLSVLQTEELVREYKYHVKSRGSHIPKEELVSFIERMKMKYPELTTKIIQTRIKGKLIFEVKGSLKESTEILRRIMKKANA